MINILRKVVSKVVVVAVKSLNQFRILFKIVMNKLKKKKRNNPKRYQDFKMIFGQRI